MMFQADSATGSLTAWYHRFWLGGEDWDLEVAGPMEARMFNRAATGEGILIFTGTHSGWFQITLRLIEEAPPVPSAEWEDVVRGSINLPEAALWAVPTGSLGEEIELPLPSAGEYGFQIAAKGREDVDHEEDDSPEAYLIDIWPATQMGESTVLRMTSEFGQTEFEGL
ncbi:MAG: pSRTUE45b [Microbacterium sp.]|jgi:hypothetical protein|nr:pSRTUE45b [Microbacterium sp.]